MISSMFPVHAMKKGLRKLGYRAVHGDVLDSSGEPVGAYYREKILEKPCVTIRLHPLHPDYRKIMEAAGLYAKDIAFCAPVQRRADRMKPQEIDFDGIWILADPASGNIEYRSTGYVHLPETYIHLADRYPLDTGELKIHDFLTWLNST